MPHEITVGHHAKIPTWTWPTILGLTLGVLGLAGLIELRPQVAVTPQGQLAGKDPFSAPFRISNTGYFSFRIKLVTCYLRELESEHVRLRSGTDHSRDWDNHVLDRGESETILCSFYPTTPQEPPKKADIAIVADIDTWFNARRYFRFVGAYGDNWQWLAQPSGDIQKDADIAVERAKGNRERFPPP
jgi:hypothetical protein